MDSLRQLWPLVRPHRRALVAAVASAALAAGLWAAALMLAFPITKVLLEQSSLQDYLQQELGSVTELQRSETWRLETLNAELHKAKASSSSSTSDVAALQQSLRQSQRELQNAANRQWWLAACQQHLLPWLPQDRFDLLTLLMCGLLVVTAVHGAAVYLQEVLIGRVVHLSMRSLRSRLFRQTLRRDCLSLMADGTPTLMSRFTNDLNSIAQGMTLLGGKVVLEPLKAGSCIVSAFLLNWRLTLLSLLCAPLGALLFQRFGKKLKKASRRQMETVARIYQVLQETLAAYRVVTAFGQQRHHRQLLYRENRAYYRRTMSILRLDALANPTVELLAVAAACMAILPGAYLVIRQKTSIAGIQLSATEMDLASLALLYSMLIGVLDPARKLSSAFSKLKKSVAACERVNEWTHLHAAVSEQPLAGGAVPPLISLRLQEVDFAYPSTQTDTVPLALNGVNVHWKRGEVIAIVGGNGCGKSTLAGLIPRFFNPTAGQILWNDLETSQLSLRELRGRIGWVPQEPMLFDRSIADNIAAGDATATRSQIQAAADRAHVSDFVQDWDDGLDTPIGSGGNRLSGGQRQRIALARALLRQPELLILDEATSAIDAQSESLIYEALQAGQDERLTLIITHTLTPSLLPLISRILFMERGRVIASGTHELLLRTCPPYLALFSAQSQRRAA